MQQSACRRGKKAECAKQYQRPVEPHNKTVVAADPAHKSIAQLFQPYQFIEVLRGNSHIRHFPRDHSAAADCNSHIGQ